MRALSKWFFAATLLCGNAAVAQLPPTNVNGLDFGANNTLAVSANNHARLRFNSGTGQLEQSISGSAYAPSGTGVFLPLAGGTMIGAISATIADLNGPHTLLFGSSVDNSVWLKIAAGDSGRYTDFYGTYSSTTNPGFNDNVLHFGHNCAPGGGPVIAGRAALCDAWESIFNGGHVQQERHLKWIDLSANETRYISFEGHQDDGSTALFIDATQISLGSGRNGNTTPSLAITPLITTLNSPAGKNFIIFDDSGAATLTIGSGPTGFSPATDIIMSPLGAIRIDSSSVGRLIDTRNSGNPSFQWDNGSSQVLSPDNRTQVQISNGVIGFNADGVAIGNIQIGGLNLGKLLSIAINNVGTNTRGDQVAAILARNNTQATGAATQQFSPVLVQTGYGWTGSASRAVSFMSQSQADGTGAGSFVWLYSNDEANYTAVASLSSVGGLAAGDGTAGAPSHSFTAHPTYGMYYDSGRVKIAAAGGDVLYIDPSFLFVNGTILTQGGGSIDTASAGSLNIGTSTATGLVLGVSSGSVGFNGVIKNLTAGNETTTVGAGGGASALPATPVKYLTIKLSDGNSYKVPVYLP